MMQRIIQIAEILLAISHVLPSWHEHPSRRSRACWTAYRYKSRRFLSVHCRLECPSNIRFKFPLSHRTHCRTCKNTAYLDMDPLRRLRNLEHYGIFAHCDPPNRVYASKSSLPYTSYVGLRVPSFVGPVSWCTSFRSISFASNAACGISFMLQTYILIRSLKKSRGMCCPSKIALWLLIAPFFVLWAIILEVLVVYLLDPSSLSRDLSGMYCSLRKNPIPVKVSSAVVILAGTTVLVLQGLIFLSLRRNWRQNVQDLRGSKISLTVLLRAVIFGFVAAVAVGMSFAYSATTSTGTALSNLPMAIVPVMDALIFGTQKDILSVWMFWREKSN